jgi:kynureninase
MNANGETPARIVHAVAALGPGSLTAEGIRQHIAPLFSRVLGANRNCAYLANHSLGRPLDATADDLAQAIGLWQSKLGDAWDDWLAEIGDYRARLAQLLGASRADCVVPKTSAGQGLRAILNTYDKVPRVVATRGEFDSIDLILRQYARRGRIALHVVEANDSGLFDAADLLAAVRQAELVVISQVAFHTGQVLPELPALIAAAHAAGARVLVDVYHSLGVFPVDVTALDVDFAIGGSYKYLRGGPGAGYLYLHPRHLDGSLSTLDVGWFGKKEPFAYQRPDPPQFGEGGDAFLESTPPVMTCYQARAGQVFTEAIGVQRLREYSLAQQRRLVSALAERGIGATGGSADYGAFVVVTCEGDDASRAARRGVEALAVRGVIADARGARIRLCPDVLTTTDELDLAARAVADEIPPRPVAARRQQGG